MSYANAADMDDHFGNPEVLLAFDRDASGSIDAGVLTAALVAATEEIDSYLAVRYDLPLGAIPGILTKVCCDIAMYQGSVGHGSMTDEKEKRYNNRVKWLMKLSKGDVSLGPKEESVSVQDDSTLSTASETRIFTRTHMRGLL